MNKVMFIVMCLVMLSGCGTQGPAGAVGERGLVGASGNNGANSQPCSVVQNDSSATISCPDGTSATVANGANGLDGVAGANGVNGINGTNGTNGADGSNGANGADGTTVSVVQLCPGFVPSYPDTFPEFGLCIADKLYGVMDQGNGYDYLSLIPAGAYASESNNASCVFTVTDGCNIQRN